MTNLVWNIIPAAFNRTQFEWNQSLISKINVASADIAKKSVHGGANIIEVADNIVFIFDSLSSFDRHRMKMGCYNVSYDKSLVSCIKIYNQNDKDDYRIIEIHGLNEKPSYTSDLMYILIGN